MTEDGPLSRSGIVWPMELLSVLWVAAIGLWFWKTDERQRETHLLFMWGLLALPVIYWAVRLALSSV